MSEEVNKEQQLRWWYHHNELRKIEGGQEEAATTWTTFCGRITGTSEILVRPVNEQENTIQESNTWEVDGPEIVLSCEQPTGSNGGQQRVWTHRTESSLPLLSTYEEEMSNQQGETVNSQAQVQRQINTWGHTELQESEELLEIHHQGRQGSRDLQRGFRGTTQEFLPQESGFSRMFVSPGQLPIYAFWPESRPRPSTVNQGQQQHEEVATTSSRSGSPTRQPEGHGRNDSFDYEGSVDLWSPWDG